MLPGHLKGINRPTIDCYNYGTLYILVDQNNNNLIAILRNEIITNHQMIL
jgi:hypothetical protein